MNNETIQVVIVDSDALIALFNKDDANAQKAEKLFQMLYEEKARLIYPATTLVETIDTMQRKLKKHAEAAQIIKLIATAQFAIESIEPINGQCIKEAAHFFEAGKTKRTTLADAVVAAVAKRNNTKLIASFDEWYEDQGFILATKMPIYEA
jgi:predicted nucleic acid-binding protein